MKALIPVLKQNMGAISCLVLAAILLLLIRSQIDDLSDMNARYEESNRALGVMMKNQAQGSELGAQLAELLKLTSGLDGRLMKPDDKAVNAQFFYGLEGRSHARIISLKQQSTSQAADARATLSKFTATAFELSLGGRIGYVASFLKKLENSKYFIRCNTISIKGDPVTAPDAIIINLKLEILSQKI